MEVTDRPVLCYWIGDNTQPSKMSQCRSRPSIPGRVTPCKVAMMPADKLNSTNNTVVAVHEGHKRASFPYNVTDVYVEDMKTFKF